MIVLILIFGALFGAVLQYASLNKYNVISGIARLDNLLVAKTIVLAIGVGALLITSEIALGLASYHVKPFLLGGILMGGLIFGAGMAILGYCPGTMAVSLGEGSWDALIGIIGGLFGGVVYTLLLPSMNGILGPNLGKISLNSLMGTNILFFVMMFIIAAAFIFIAFWLHKKDKSKNQKWIYSGIALAVLNAIVFAVAFTNRPIGASTSYPYVADVITGFTDNDYFEKIKTPGNWELIFLSGAFLAALVISMIKKEFKFTLIHSSWKEYHGESKGKRIFWAFIGGFILIFGARMAGGCTSGHILSGGMQLAMSSLVFGVFVFAGLLITGKLFYRK